MSSIPPDLEVLLEFLQDEPADELYREVARKLATVGEHSLAVDVLLRAFQHGATDLDDARLLASWAADLRRFDAIGLAAKALGPEEVERDPTLAKGWALYLESTGDLAGASEVARELLAEGPDEDLQAIVNRSDAAAPDPATRGRDPFYTASRAEAYHEIGRNDLAIRVLRRIQAARPDDLAIQARLLQLRAAPSEQRPWVEDLSEEYWVNRPMGPLIMPASQLARVPVNDPFGDDLPTDQSAENPTDPGASSPVHAQSNSVQPSHDTDDEATQLFTTEALDAAMAELVDVPVSPSPVSDAEASELLSFDDFDPSPGRSSSSSSRKIRPVVDPADDEATQVFSADALAKLARGLDRVGESHDLADPDDEATQIYRPPKLEP